MSKRFLIEISTLFTMELSDKVLNAVDDKWREQFYNFKTPEEIAQHIAYNMVINNAKLSQLDGFADQPNEYAELLDTPIWDTHIIETSEGV